MRSLHGLASLVGLTQIKQLASVSIKSCLARNTVFGHTLLYGIGGTGKTALARALGEETESHFVELEGAALRDREQIIECLARNSVAAKKARRPLLLFVDEVHRLHRKLQEVFYIPMKEWRVSTEDGWVNFPPFTLVAATTRRDMLDERSFVQRFNNQWEVTRYRNIHIRQIVAELFGEWRVTCSNELVERIASRCLGIPRIATNLAAKVRDFALASGQWAVCSDHVVQAFDLEGIDEIGLSRLHIRYLRVLYDAVSTRGVASIASQLAQPQNLLEATIEPILCELRLIEHGPRGRVITDRGRRYVGRLIRLVRRTAS